MSLDPVLQRLTNDIPQAGYDRRSLAQLVLHLQQFMEIALGINVSPAPSIAPSFENVDPFQKSTFVLRGTHLLPMLIHHNESAFSCSPYPPEPSPRYQPSSCGTARPTGRCTLSLPSAMRSPSSAA